MKKNNVYNFVYPVLFLLIGIFTGCTKDDGPIKKDVLKDIQAVPAINTAIDPSGSQAIDVLNLDQFEGKFTVSPYFADAKAPEKVDIVVRRTRAGNTTVKVYKADVTTLPASFTISSTDLESLFDPIQLNDNYDFSADIYANGGKKYEAFPAGGIGTASGPITMPGYSEYARFGAICAYNPEIYQGDFEVVSDDWEEFAPGDVIALTKVSDNQFSFLMDPASSTGPYTPAIVTVNTLNNNVSIPKTIVAAGFYTYSSYTIVTDASGSFVSPCDELLTLSLGYSVSIGGWGGGYKLVLRKKH
jgi:hypothetical protein